MAGLNNPLAGRVEVCYSRLWGTMCSSGWTNPDAEVVCRQLGFSSSGDSFLMITFISFFFFFSFRSTSSLEGRLNDCIIFCCFFILFCFVHLLIKLLIM